MPYDKKVLAANLRSLRARSRMTQAQLAKIIKVSETSIANYEKGEGNPSYEVCWAIADFYGVTLDALGGRESGDLSGAVI